MNIDTNEVKEIINGLKSDSLERATHPYSAEIVSIVCQAMIERIEIWEETEIEGLAQEFERGLK